jgi:hypothetical protein
LVELAIAVKSGTVTGVAGTGDAVESPPPPPPQEAIKKAVTNVTAMRKVNISFPLSKNLVSIAVKALAIKFRYKNYTYLICIVCLLIRKSVYPIH